ncbi:DNRLRE domain-containing protein [Anoxybacillus sp. LAT_31]|uniref:DNRLRE domain-containing protein n=2 Tax=Anoxybacillus TaxID=150247 RepID=UPI001EDBAF3F|nr:DNRLRE domain-containing protein [Anoxybacillus sp. LAT27]
MEGKSIFNYRYVAMILSCCLIFSIVVPPFAQAAPGKSERVVQKSRNIEANIGDLPTKRPKSKLELESRRTKYSTRYLNPDGSFTEEIYLQPQFYQDPLDKKWKKINNDLKPNGADMFENTANAFKVTFAKQSSQPELVSIKENDRILSFIPINAKNVQGVAKNNEIIYKGLFEQTDVRYRLQGNAVKEDIILNNKPSSNAFTFEMKLKGVKAVAKKDGTIVFEDSKGNPKWYLEKPYMFDANHKYSDQVAFHLRQNSGKTYIDVIVDESFLQDPDTIYPVTIDPTINEWDVLRDNFIAYNFPDSVYSSNTYMHTGYNSYFGTTRALVRFYLPSLPSDSVISSATFNAYQTNADGQQVSIDLHRITSNWSSSVTWNNQPSIRSTKESTTTNNTANTYWSWDITQLVKDWYNGIQPNYGLMLKQQNESSSPYRTFNTVNNSVNTPRITINYWVEPIGQESFWTTTKDGVNPANGNLVLQTTDLAISGLGEDVEFTRTYNSRKSGSNGMFGYGWMSNLEMNIWDAGSGPVTFVDGDNTRHIFGEKVGGGYEAAGGVYLDLIKNGDGTYTITKTDGTKLYFNTNGKLSRMVDTNGNTTTLNYNANGKLASITDASARTTTIAYGTNGYVSSITDPANRTISYEYDASGNLTKVTDAQGNATIFTYDSDHNLTSIKNARNITTTIGYDTLDRVTSIERPITINGALTNSTTNYSYDKTNGVTSVTDGEGRRVDYTYNANGNIIQITENPLDAQNKAVTTFDYDNNNNLTRVVEPNENKANGTAAFIYQYDEKGNIVSVQLPENQSAQYTYDLQNNLIKEQDFNSNVSTFDYDQNNNQTEAIDPYTQSVSQRYDNLGNLQYSTYPMSTADNLVSNSSFEFDHNADNWPDNWTKAVESGKIATFSWTTTSKFGNKAISISNSTGWAIVSSDKQPYDGGVYVASGYVKTSSMSARALIKVEYFDAQGNWLNQKISYGLAGTNDWTRLHVVADNAPSGTQTIRVSVGVNAGSGTAYFDGIQLEKGTVVSAYNLVDNSSFERDMNSDGIPDNWTTSGNLSTNDGLDTTVANIYVGSKSFKITGESGKNKHIKQRINISGDSNTKLTLSGWSKQEGANPNGGYYSLQVAIHYTNGTTDWGYANDFDKAKTDWQHVAAEVKPKQAFDYIDVYYYYYNQTGTAWFDAMRLEVGASLTSYTYDAKKNYVTKVTDPAGNMVSYTYDAIGNQTSVTDGKGKTTSYEYNNNNQLTKVTDPNGNVTTYGYDGAGNRTSVTNAKNYTTNYTYNEWNQISSFKNPLNQTTSFAYDKNGNITGVTYANGDRVSYSYNALNRLIAVAYNGTTKWTFNYDANGNVTSVTDANGNATTYTYDKNNRLTRISKGSSNAIAYGYDDNGNVTSTSITAGTTTDTIGYSYNPLDQLVVLSRNSANLARFTYDERGNISAIIHANGTYTAYEYNDANQLKSLKNFDANGNVLNYFLYSYDANGDITAVETKDGTITYEYDALNQLTKETLADGTAITYEYDAVGNRTKKIVNNGTTTTTTYTYDAADQLTAVNGQAYTYDVNGNLTNNGNKTFVYDDENRLIQVKNASGTTIATYTYDHQGRRISKTTSSGTTYYHYDGDSIRLLYETDANNNITAEYTWDALGRPVTMTKAGATYYYHLNGHGDVVALTDASGNVVAQYEYDAWGNILSKTGALATANPYRYAGYYYDEETGLYYLMARYYEANMGRFLTRDTFHGVENEPQSLNQYVYTKNNPVNSIDPNGHYSKRLDLGFNSYIKVNIGWQEISVTINLTPGFLISTGIGFGAGLAASYVIKQVLTWYLFPVLSNIILTKAAEKVVNYLAKKLSKSAFKKITKGYNWTKKSIFYTSLVVPNLIFRY